MCEPLTSPQIMEIAGKTIGVGSPCFLIGEAGVNHNGSLEMALQLVDVALEAGVDAVKFQTFSATRVVVRDTPKARYQKETTGNDESQLEMLQKLELSPKAHREIQAYCNKRGILFLSTPFDEESADLLEDLHVPAFKIPSGEITNLPFLVHIARKGKPLIVSTGMSTMEEVEAAVASIRLAGNEEFALLHCVSAYPAQPADANLRAMWTMAKAFGVPIGYSDHTLGAEVALAAVALGAQILEKHFTLDRSLPGPDHSASLEPGELRSLVKGVRTVEAAIGHGRKEPRPAEADVAAVSRKSIVAVCDIPAGTQMTRDLLIMKTPGTGWPPSMLDKVLGRVTAKPIPVDTILTDEMFQ
jgi:N,N'-diacetyllegionaminate synthase